jgi:hypothetical protein
VSAPEAPSLDRALPSTIIDLIRDGAPAADLRARGDKAVYAALCRTACSALQRGWSRAEWQEEVQAKRSRLGVQVALRGGTKERPAKAVEGTMRSAWGAAERWIATAPKVITREDVDRKCVALRDLIADADVPLRDNDRAILAHAVEEARRRGTDRPTLPLRAVVDATGLGMKAVRLALARLDETGLLVCEVRGVPSRPNSPKARASAYRLPDPAVLAALVVPREADSPPIPEQPKRPTMKMLSTLTLENPSPELLADIAELLARHGQPDAPVHTNTLPGNVTPIRRPATRAAGA